MSINHRENRSEIRRFIAVLAIILTFQVSRADEAGTNESHQVSRSCTSHTISADDRLSCAQEHARKGKFAIASLAYLELIAEHPQNVDYVFGYAQTLFWSGDNGAALRFIRQARLIAPDYIDVWKLELQILKAQGGMEARIAAEKLRQAGLEKFPAADWLLQPESRDENYYRWEVALDRDFLSNNTPDWQSIYINVERIIGQGNIIFLKAGAYDRFNVRDNEFSIGTSLKFLSSWLVAGSVSVSDTPNFLPERLIDISVGRIFEHGWISSVRGKSRQFTGDSVNGVGIAVERYVDNFRFAYSIDGSRFRTEATITHQVSGNLYTNSKHQFGVKFAFGEEIEATAPGQLLRTDVRSVFFSGRHPVFENISVAWRIGRHWQGSLYRRDNIGISVSGGF